MRARLSFESVSPYCRMFRPVLGFPIYRKRNNVSHQFRYVYLRIPKAANSTVLYTLRAAETGDTSLNRDEIESLKKNHGTRLSELSRKQLNQVLGSYFKFTVVRHPFARLLSCYLDKITTTKYPTIKSHVSKYFNKHINDYVSFDEFLFFLEKGNNIRLDGHWARQTELIVMPVTLIDYVGKVESIETDMKEITRRIYGVDKKIQNWIPHRTNSGDKLSTYVTDERIEKVFTLYRDDFLSFGYDKTPDQTLEVVK